MYGARWWAECTDRHFVVLIWHSFGVSLTAQGSPRPQSVHSAYRGCIACHMIKQSCSIAMSPWCFFGLPLWNWELVNTVSRGLDVVLACC